MIKHEGDKTTITCDKCKHESIAPKSRYNEIFYSEGWLLNRGRKYMHLCNNCLTPKQRDAFEFIRQTFG